MTTCGRMLTVLVLFLSPLLSFAQETYTLKPRHDMKGDVSNIVREEKIEESTRTFGPDGKETQKKSHSMVVNNVFREETLEKIEGQRPTKVARTYAKAEVRQGHRVERFPYCGKTVMIQQSGNTFVFSIDGKTLDPKDLGTLPKDFDLTRPSELDSEKKFLPGKPVAEGETWAIEAKDLLRTLSGKAQAEKSFQLEKAVAKGKLLKVYKKDAAQFGLIDIQLIVPLKEFNGQFPCKEGATMTIKITGDLCIDGTRSGGKSTTLTTMRGTADMMKENKPTGTVVDFNLTTTVTSTGTPVKK